MWLDGRKGSSIGSIPQWDTRSVTNLKMVPICQKRMVRCSHHQVSICAHFKHSSNLIHSSHASWDTTPSIFCHSNPRSAGCQTCLDMGQDYTEAGIVKFVLNLPSDVNPYSATAELLISVLRVSQSSTHSSSSHPAFPEWLQCFLLLNLFHSIEYLQPTHVPASTRATEACISVGFVM